MPVLTYHAVDPVWRASLSVSPARFADHCAWLARRRRVISARDAAATWSSSGRLPPRTVAITFDDGYANLHAHALPELARHDLPAIVFLVSATLSEGAPVSWLDRPPAEPLPTLDLSQIQEMRAAGIEFGSHTHTHPDLTSLTDAECARELQQSKTVLEDLLNEEVTLLAYPRGLHDRRVQRAAQEAGYAFAFGTSKRFGTPNSFAIPRTGIYADDGRRALFLKTTPQYDRLKRALRR